MTSHVSFYCYDYIYCNHKYYFKKTSGSAAYTELSGLYASSPNPRYASRCLEPPTEILRGGQLRAKVCGEGLTFWDCQLSWEGW